MRPNGKMINHDQEYINKVIQGETEYFGPLTASYSQEIFLLILKIIRNREDAEELTQDTFLKAFRTLSTFKGECRFSTWLYRIAYNTAISATRKKKQEFLYIDEQTINQVSDTDMDEQFENGIREEQLASLNEALNHLPPDERGMILLFYREQKTIEEITTVTGLSLSNVKVKLHRIRKKLYLMLNQNKNNLV